METYTGYKSCISCGASIDYDEEICYNCGDDGFGEYIDNANSDGKVPYKK
jgi:hypothetical protein